MLNVNKIYAFVLGTLLLASCASDELKPTDGLNESSKYVEGNSTYRIRLNGRETATVSRAAILGNESTAVLDSMGIFALARTVQGTNEAAYPIQWFNDDRNWSFCIMDNVVSEMENGNIIWKDEQAIYFYPITQFYNYDFYGYYPYTDDITRYDNSIVAHYTIDGTQDLIWGRATSNADFAYSAKYYRTYGNGAIDPTVDLEHLLTRLTFTIEPSESFIGSNDYTESEAMRVKSIEICDAYTNLDVLVADRENVDEADWSNPDYANRVTLRNLTTDTLALKQPDGSAIGLTQVPLHTEPALQVGESLMLFPATSYMIKVVIIDQNNIEHVSEIPLTLTLDPNDPQMFARGNSYTVRIIIHGPHAVSLKGTLVDWNDITGPTVEL